jgi:hypothetical protein
MTLVYSKSSEYKLLSLILGTYTDSASFENKQLITERHCFSDLVEGLSMQCPYGMTSAPWVLESTVQE